MGISKKMATELSRLRLPGREWQVFWAVVARAGKKSSLKEFSQLAGISVNNCWIAIKSLIKKNIFHMGEPLLKNEYKPYSKLSIPILKIEYSHMGKTEKNLSQDVFKKEKKERKNQRKKEKKESISLINNNQSLFNTNINKVPIYNKYKNKRLKETVKEIIEYLNLKSGKNFRTTTPATIAVINARLMEGFTIENFKKAIDVKCPKWKDDPEMEMYLRPITLFCKTKFEGYTQEKLPVTKEEDFEKKKREFIEMGKKEN